MSSRPGTRQPPTIVIPTEGVSPQRIVIPTGDDSPQQIVIPTEGFSPSGGTCFSPATHLNIILAETEREATLVDILRPHPSLQSLALAIGPEGGWTEDELQSFATAQWLSASLGDTILRAETAAIAALAIARAAL